MRTFALILAVLVATFVAPAHAGEETPAEQIKRWYDLIIGTGLQQNARCSGSTVPERCAEEYSKLYDVAFKVVSLEMLHDEAGRRKDYHTARFLYPRYDAAFKEMHRLDKELKNRYPLPSTSATTSQTSKRPKVRRTGK